MEAPSGSAGHDARVVQDRKLKRRAPDANAPPTAGRLGSFPIAAAILLQLAAVAPAIVQEIRTRVHEPVAWVIPAEMAADIRAIRGRIPEVEPLLYVDDSSNPWLARLWERALSPQPVVIVDSHRRLSARVAPFKKRFDLRWALSAGSPPIDPGFAWRVRFPPVPGFAPEYGFGKLAR